MKQFLHIVFGAAVVFTFITSNFGQVTPDSDLQKFGEEFTPVGMEAAHKTVRGRFAESASSDGSEHVVILSRPVSGLRRYSGAVVLLIRPDKYGHQQLPDPKSTWSMMEPIAIFFANADGDAENELFIIDECYTGIGPDGAKPFYRTRVYDWNGISFSHLDPVSEKIGNVKTVAGAKARLRQLSRTLSLTKTEMFKSVDFLAYSLTIEKAARAGEAWVKEPAQIIARTFGGFSEVRSQTVEFVAPTADGADTLTVTITSDGLMDDSVRGEKFRLGLKADQQGVWRFTSASKSWRCQPGRGSQSFTTVKCS